MAYENLVPTFDKLAEEYPTVDLLAQVERILNNKLNKFEEPCEDARIIQRVLSEVQAAKHTALFID